MDRRQFIKNSFLASVLVGSGFPWSKLMAADATNFSKKVFLNLVLQGGPDFRHLFPPAYSANESSFGYNYWANRYLSHNLDGKTNEWQRRWNDDYYHVESNGFEFGILKRCGWLKTMFDEGKVAIINNVLACSTRDHFHGLIQYYTGNREATPFDIGLSGWGGRLAESLNGKVVSLGSEVLQFCQGSDVNNPLNPVISIRDSRNMALAVPDELRDDPGSKNKSAILARALKSYYEGKRGTIDESSPYYKFLQHEQTLRNFGDQVQSRLESVTVPTGVSELSLNSSSFAQQIQNTYDALACADILDFRIGSLNYGGWDSHKYQVENVEDKLEDIFGTSGGLSKLYSGLDSRFPTIKSNTVFMIGGEFGRQLKANGNFGTDHGRGMSIILIGDKVRGGIYGNMFPDSELDRLSDASPDINGLTDIEKIYAEVCNWMSSGTGSQVFPKLSSASLEAGVNFSRLFI